MSISKICSLIIFFILMLCYYFHVLMREHIMASPVFTDDPIIIQSEVLWVEIFIVNLKLLHFVYKPYIRNRQTGHCIPPSVWVHAVHLTMHTSFSSASCHIIGIIDYITGIVYRSLYNLWSYALMNEGRVTSCNLSSGFRELHEYTSQHL